MASKNQRPPFESFYVYILVTLIAYVIADLTILNLRPGMLPTEAPPAKPERRKALAKPRSYYLGILERNIFNSDGKIAPAISSEKSGKPTEEQAPVLSNLPLELMGTIVHGNPIKSVASILVKSAGAVNPYMIDDEIERLAKVIKIERKKVIIRNLNNSRLEYIEIPKDYNIDLGLSQPAAKPETESVIRKTGKFDFAVNRSDVTKMLDDLPNLLKEGRVVPNYESGSTQIAGFKFVWIKPGGVFEKLGFKVGDIIKGANGEPINNPRKAMEAFNALRESTNITINTLREGRDEDFNYNVENN